MVYLISGITEAERSLAAAKAECALWTRSTDEFTGMLDVEILVKGDERYHIPWGKDTHKPRSVPLLQTKNAHVGSPRYGYAELLLKKPTIQGLALAAMRDGLPETTCESLPDIIEFRLRWIQSVLESCPPQADVLPLPVPCAHLELNLRALVCPKSDPNPAILMRALLKLEALGVQCSTTIHVQRGPDPHLNLALHRIGFYRCQHRR